MLEAAPQPRRRQCSSLSGCHSCLPQLWRLLLQLFSIPSHVASNSSPAPGLLGSCWGCCQVNLLQGTNDMLENQSWARFVDLLGSLGLHIQHALWTRYAGVLSDILPRYLPLRAALLVYSHYRLMPTTMLLFSFLSKKGLDVLCDRCHLSWPYALSYQGWDDF